MSPMNVVAVAALRVIAAVANKAAMDLEAGKLWPGQLKESISVIRANLEEAAKADR
jgi:hypothetical protein